MARRPQHIPKDLGDGLVLRRARPEDADALVRLNAEVLGDGGADPVVGRWTRDLMEGKHPTFRPADFTLVEDVRRGVVVSSMNLFSQIWSYGGIAFGVGRPDLVNTLPDYRRRGLVRAQFEVIHAWSKARGHLLQAITGIPCFYRQFGYETALEFDGCRQCHRSAVPRLKEREKEPYRLRPAEAADLTFIGRVYTQATSRSLVAQVLSPRLWRYHVLGRISGEQFRIIERRRGERVGFLAHEEGVREGARLGVILYELAPGESWLSVQPSVLRYLERTGAEYAARDQKDFHWVRFRLGSEHPCYAAAPDLLTPPRDPSALYLRVPDLPAFLRHLAPVLEARLVQSVAPGWSGDLKLSFYRTGVRLAFAGGKLAGVGPWTPSEGGESAAFRDLTFLQLLFGFRSLQELRAANPDCWASGNEARVLLTALFPKQPSALWAFV
jgi:hypothetical protein